MKKALISAVLAVTLAVLSMSFPAAIDAEVSQIALINSQGALFYDYACSLTEDDSMPDFWAGGAIINGYTNLEIFVTCDPSDIKDDIIRITGNDNIKVTQVEYSYNFLMDVKEYISNKKSELYDDLDKNPEARELFVNIPVVALDVVANSVIVTVSSNYDRVVDLFKKYIIDVPYVSFVLAESEI